MADRSVHLERGRASYGRRAWAEAHAALSEAAALGPLDGEELELLATSAYMLGRDDEWMDVLERAHHAHLEAGEPLRALRCAFWVGTNSAREGEMARAGGWLGRAARLLEEHGDGAVEQGYMLLPLMFRDEAAGDYEAADAKAERAAAIARSFGDTDLFALALIGRGQMLIKTLRIGEGLGLLDEAMVCVTAGETSPIVSGFVYCGMIAACQQVYELRRAAEWTGALTRWCEGQPELVAFTGRCLVHRAEVMQAYGDWDAALAEARSAAGRFEQAGDQRTGGLAYYRQGELLRLRGRHADAEEAYRQASRCGREPQPGLALLRLAQGRTDQACASIRRVLAETTDPLARAGLLPAQVEIALAAGDLDTAAAACREMEGIVAPLDSAMLGAMCGHARGSVQLAAGEAEAALVTLREAWRRWDRLEAPYEAARARAAIAAACRALGDGDAARLELEAARAELERLGAGPDLERLDGGGAPGGHGLTARELEVLRLVAAGQTNRAIAEALVISEHTVSRHLQNIFAKLGVSSRSAATAFAFEHEMV